MLLLIVALLIVVGREVLDSLKAHAQSSPSLGSGCPLNGPVVPLLIFLGFLQFRSGGLISFKGFPRESSKSLAYQHDVVGVSVVTPGQLNSNVNERDVPVDVRH